MQVAFNNNKRTHLQAEHLLSLRYTLVVTTDTPATLPQSRQQDRAALLDNGDDVHKTVTGVTLQQARHFLDVVARQHGGAAARH